MVSTVANSSRTKPKPHLLIAYGLDEHNKPRAAQFIASDTAIVAKAAAASDLDICEAASASLKSVAKALPVGRLCANGRASVPFIESPVYRVLFDALVEHSMKDKDKPKIAPSGLPNSWRDIGPGHLVVAQESLEQGWAEAVVLERKGNTLKLRYRDYPYLPKFARQVTAVALLSAAATRASQGPSAP
jgi:hypothetical protein